MLLCLPRTLKGADMNPTTTYFEDTASDEVYVALLKMRTPAMSVETS